MVYLERDIFKMAIKIAALGQRKK